MAEKDWYPEIAEWTKQYLKDKYKGYDVEVTHESSVQKLDVVLQKRGIDCPMAKGLDIEVDIVGILKKAGQYKLVFVEVKDVPLKLTHLGQLWGYCQLINPEEAFLVSPKGLGTLGKCLIDLRRTDILQYGENHINKAMKVAKWDALRKTIDYTTLVQ